MMKVLVSGEVDVICCDLKELVPALQKIESVEQVTFENWRPLLEKQNSWRNLSEAGCKGYYMRMTANGAIFVPAGFAIVEMVKSGVLVHGLRRSLVIKSELQA